MIIVNVCGGLGNQLFQYAIGRRIALARGVELVLDTSWYRRLHRRRSVTARQFELGDFHVSARETRPEEARKARNSTHRFWRHFPLIPRYDVVREVSKRFQPDVFQAKDGTYLLGFWQCPRYFEDIRTVLMEDLAIRVPLSREEKLTEDRIIESQNAVAVHVRRGDYVTLASAAKFHGTCGVEYYQNAVTEMEQRLGRPNYFVFSDDMEWARNNLSFMRDACFVAGEEGRPSCVGIHLMASCKHNVIANSSYSWWGAWLGRELDRIVIAPKHWSFGGPQSAEVLPASWIAL